MKKLLLFLVLMLIPLTAMGEIFIDAPVPEDWAELDTLRITVFKTGESDCMLLESGGECMMMDGGANKWREDLRNALNARGITHLKYLLNTHPHDDHIDGLYRLMQYGFTADEFLSPFKESFSHDLHSRTVKQAEKSGIPYRQLFENDQLQLGNATLTMHRWEDGSSINDKSGMFRVEFGNASALLCADITGLAQRYLLANLPAEELKADLIKAPHHGLTACAKEFLDAVDPGFIYMTNYKTDTPAMVNQAEYRDIPFMHSGSGTITLETNGTDWYINQALKTF
ncbi:MAG: MBL fold metallo-hydrolase [Clostridia bacterium]|nr:MBL fold metallo-hydrolase [Clostridia bacterium]